MWASSMGCVLFDFASFQLELLVSNCDNYFNYVFASNHVLDLGRSSGFNAMGCCDANGLRA